MGGPEPCEDKTPYRTPDKSSQPTDHLRASISSPVSKNSSSFTLRKGNRAWCLAGSGCRCFRDYKGSEGQKEVAGASGILGLNHKSRGKCSAQPACPSVGFKCQRVCSDSVSSARLTQGLLCVLPQDTLVFCATVRFWQYLTFEPTSRKHKLSVNFI